MDEMTLFPIVPPTDTSVSASLDDRQDCPISYHPSLNHARPRYRPGGDEYLGMPRATPSALSNYTFL
jgi:hypothetical protein